MSDILHNGRCQHHEEDDVGHAPSGPRPRGRPRREIDLEAVADAVAELFAEGGFDAVSINTTAEMLSVSRATLYRTVPTKEHLVGILFERSTRELTDAAQEILARPESPREHLYALVRLQIDAAVRMRRYMPVFFGGAGLPPDVFERWHTWSRRYEKLWTDAVTRAMDAGALERAEPMITARLLLGMCIWVSRWYRPTEGYENVDIAEAAISLLHSPPIDNEFDTKRY
ncbi:TetR/AcrR family transcriptional regulator [Parafrankia sp. FMc2]|uniref:TetR/AcrR family transcriptional regulator n=1 Tax=Parafrankia sp. FMc2 TaxID=3233196 RepID=UPI0034D47E84